MSKKILIFGFLLLHAIAFFAQRERMKYLPTFDQQRIHFGFYLGLNQNDFKLNLRESTVTNTNTNITVAPNTGFIVGMIADLRLNENLNLRFEPGLVSNSKIILFNHLNTSKESIREIGSSYIHVPIVLKFSTNRYKNIRPYVLSGFSYDHNLSSNEKNQDDNSAGQFRMKTHNFMYEVGVGIDFYLYFFKISPSIRAVFAINNEIKYDDDPISKWTAPINFLGTRGVFLTFAFENP